MRGVLRKLRELPPGRRRLFWLMMALTVVFGVLPPWLIVTGHAAASLASTSKLGSGAPPVKARAPSRSAAAAA